MKTAILLLASVSSILAADCQITDFIGIAPLATDPAGPFATCAADIGDTLASLMNPNWVPKDATAVSKFSKSANCKNFFTTVTTYMPKINPPCTLHQGKVTMTTDVAAKISFDEAVKTWGAMYTPATTAPAPATTAPAPATTAPATKPSTTAPASTTAASTTAAAATTKPASTGTPAVTTATTSGSATTDANITAEPVVVDTPAPTTVAATPAPTTKAASSAATFGASTVASAVAAAIALY
ncbi:hypothetical protein THRCLA_10240 [Thraustotheca clavata]|uniref:Secreted protein n=1 Tax=Thraustotheca clavata TaxID=74557 RepID=A0A0A7CME2_9STRA|nr:secreted protein [Thraustotheca clavata]OQR88567.1 hypothetical protein THRCLA_10240 [Thraustotheca clavata]